MTIRSDAGGTIAIVTFSGLTAVVAAGVILLGADMSTAQEAKTKLKSKSGYEYLEKSTRQMQDDDFANPGFFFVEAGEEAWRKVVGKAGKSCASCHGAAAQSMRGVGARYPAWNKALQKVVNIEHRINRCRTAHMKAPALRYESDTLLALTTWVRHQSRGLPVQVSIKGQASAAFKRGRTFWFKRRGLFDLSCAHCHDDKAGKRLRAEIISQGQINGFPTYKLKWQKIGSSHRQFRRCNRLARSVPFAFGSQSYVDLELYLAWRGSGLKVETPSVRP